MSSRIARHVAHHDGERGKVRLARFVKGCCYWALVGGVALVMGVQYSEGEQVTATSTGFGQWDIAKTLITILFGLAVWFSAQKLNRIDKKFDMLFKWKGETDIRMTTLETEHKLRTGRECRPRRNVTDSGEANDD